MVESSSYGLMQHNPYTWVVDTEAGSFVPMEELKNSVRLMDSAVTDWILGLDDEQISHFSDVLFRLLAASETDNLIDFAADWKKSLSGMLQELKEVDDGAKAEMEEILKGLFEITGQMTKKEIQGKILGGIRGIQERFSRKSKENGRKGIKNRARETF